MSKTLEFLGPEPQLGLRTRKTTLGPELDLVSDFVRNYAVELFESDSNVAIFQEPALPSGFPDIVAAEFRAEAYDSWTGRRASLDKSHLKTLQHLYTNGPLEVQTTANQLGRSIARTAQIVQDLIDSGLVVGGGCAHSVSAHPHSFGISRLIAIEAKIDNLKSAFLQSIANQWFASETYILCPAHRLLPRTLELSCSLNIGILSSAPDGLEIVRPVRSSPLPTSWVSWQFNEWLARRLNEEDVDA